MNDKAVCKNAIATTKSSSTIVKNDQKRSNESTSAQKPTTLVSSSIAQKQDSVYKVAKSSKKINKVLPARPAIEIYKPPVLRRDVDATKSFEDLYTTTRPFSVAGQKQPVHSGQNPHAVLDFKRNSTEYLHNSPAHAPNKSSLASKAAFKNRTFSHKSADNLRQVPSPGKLRPFELMKNGHKNGSVASKNRSATPPSDVVNFGSQKNSQQSQQHPEMKNSNGQFVTVTNGGMKRSSSFVKDMPKKKTFGAKELQEAKELFGALNLPDDELIKTWIEANFENQEVAQPIGQVLVQMTIENAKPVKTVGKLCALLVDCPSGEKFHEGLVKSCGQYYDCRVKLKSDHFKFWLAFINCVTELYACFGFIYQGELVDILLNIYSFVLHPSVLEHIKIEELESLISSLLSVGYNLERQCPEKLNNFLVQLRDSFIEAGEPWVRKMLLLMIELSASNWKLPNEANEYYFQTTHHANGTCM